MDCSCLDGCVAGGDAHEELTVAAEINSIDSLILGASSGKMSRRELMTRGAALGLSAPFLAALASAATSVRGVAAQGEVTLSFDAATTGGGGGKPTEDILSFCRIVDGGSQFELDRMVDIRLVTLSADLQSFVGELAESWTVEDTTATFKLRAGATWHDGTPLTSKDVVFTINTLSNPAANSRWGSNFTNVVGYDELQAGTATTMSGVTAPDDTTVVIELAQVDSGLLSGFMFISILPEHILSTADLTKICELPFWTEGRIGAGPFKFVQIVTNERIELVANENYILGAPAIDKLNLLFFTSFETSLAAFQQGASLAAPMTVLNLELVQSMEDAEILTTPAGVGYIQFNLKQPGLSDVRVRQAVSYAIDRKTICEQLFLGYADPVASEVPYLAWTQPADLNPYDFDPDKAKSLLSEAGFDGSKTYKMWYYYPDQLTATVMEACQQYLAAVGFNVEIVFDDGSGVRTKEVQDGTWEMLYGSFGAQPNPAGLTIVWGCAAEKTYTYCNPDFDAAIAEGVHASDPDAQAAAYQKAIKILNTDVPSVWLFNRKNLIAVSKKLITGPSVETATPTAAAAQNAWGPGSVLYFNHAYNWTIAE
jgi:peptide/nickel transport system substrate-binding protein